MLYSDTCSGGDDLEIGGAWCGVDIPVARPKAGKSVEAPIVVEIIEKIEAWAHESDLKVFGGLPVETDSREEGDAIEVVLVDGTEEPLQVGRGLVKGAADGDDTEIFATDAAGVGGEAWVERNEGGPAWIIRADQPID